MKDKKAIFVNTASQIAGRIATLAFAIISLKILTNYFGPAGTGEYNTITTYINFFIVIADLGIFSVAVREIAKDQAKEKHILANATIIRLVTATFAALCAIAIIFFTNYNEHIKLGTLVASGFIVFNLLSSIYDVILQVRLKMQFSAMAELISKLLTLVALYIITIFHGSFYLVVATITLSGLLILLFKWLFARRFISFKPKMETKVTNWLFSLAWPMGIVFILNNLFFKVDMLILSSLKDSAEVGIYSVAYKILEVTVFAGAYFASALKPTLAANITKHKDLLSGTVSKAFTIMLLISAPITLTSILYPREIITFLSNQDFVAGSTALIILSLTLPVIYFDMLMGEILIANNERMLLVKIATFMLTFNILSNLILIPLYSFNGAAIATLASEVLLGGINFYYTRKILPYRLDIMRAFRILLACLLTVGIGLLVKNQGFNIIFLASLVFVSYGLCIYALQVLNLDHIRSILKEENA